MAKTTKKSRSYVRRLRRRPIFELPRIEPKVAAPLSSQPVFDSEIGSIDLTHPSNHSLGVVAEAVPSLYVTAEAERKTVSVRTAGVNFTYTASAAAKLAAQLMEAVAAIS